MVLVVSRIAAGILLIGMMMPAGAQSPLSTRSQAIARANAITRLQTASGSVDAVPVKVKGDVTPFLGDGNEGKSAWRVTYSGASLKFAAAPTDAHRRTFEVMLETSSGSLLFITSTSDGPPAANMRPMPSCSVATKELRDNGELYAGYPDHDSKIDFLAALEDVLRDGKGSPALAREMHAAYVFHTRLNEKPRPVWVITLRGLPPFEAHGPNPKGVAVERRTSLRNVVDAATGKVLFAANTP
jgi:hypothetical protein